MKIMAFINWVKENWFKLSILFFLVVFILLNLYSFLLIQENHLIIRCNKITSNCVLIRMSRNKSVILEPYAPSTSTLRYIPIDER